MARTRTIASNLYAAGQYGPFAIDGFTKNNVDHLKLTLTRENWPDIGTAITVVVLWDSGDGARADFPGGVIMQPGEAAVETTSVLVVAVPQAGGSKRNVAGGTVTFTVHADLRTAVSLEAV